MTAPVKQPFLPDFIIGISDGLVVPFAFTTALGTAGMPSSNIILVGVATVLAGGIAMGIGGYNTMRDEYHSHGPGGVKRGAKELYAKLDLTSQVQEEASADIEKEQHMWQEQITGSKAGSPVGYNPMVSAFTIGLAYIFGGIIPVLPYMLISSSADAVKISAGLTLLSLFIFGLLKANVTGRIGIVEALKAVFIGILAGGAAYTVARIFNQQ